jgi:hypothetical protein
MNNPAQSAILSKVAFDAYFGKDVRPGKTDATVFRAAYARKTGNVVIGLDPREATLYPMFPSMLLLAKKLTQTIRKILPISMVQEFNHVSMKMYHPGRNDAGTRCPEHTDITFDYDHSAPDWSKNSQMPNTPVVICSFGDDKVLEFLQYEGKGIGRRRYRGDKRKTIRKPLQFYQRHRSVVLLHPDDEAYGEFGGRRKYYWKHRSNTVDRSSGVCFTLMFRSVLPVVEVHRDTNKHVNPEPPKGPRKERMDEKWIDMESESHLKEMNKIVSHISKRMTAYVGDKKSIDCRIKKMDIWINSKLLLV